MVLRDRRLSGAVAEGARPSALAAPVGDKAELLVALMGVPSQQQQGDEDADGEADT